MGASEWYFGHGVDRCALIWTRFGFLMTIVACTIVAVFVIVVVVKLFLAAVVQIVDHTSNRSKSIEAAIQKSETIPGPATLDPKADSLKSAL